MDQFVADELVDALYRDSLSDSHPISVSVQDPAEISELFDAISYRKVSEITHDLLMGVMREIQSGAVITWSNIMQYFI